MSLCGLRVCLLALRLSFSAVVGVVMEAFQRYPNINWEWQYFTLVNYDPLLAKR
jgi:hypothetical protein